MQLLGRFRSKLHPSDEITTDALILPVKRYWLHEKRKHLYVGYFFCPNLMLWQSWLVTNVFLGLWSPWLLQGKRHILGIKMSIIHYRNYVLNFHFRSIDTLYSLVIVYSAIFTSIHWEILCEILLQNLNFQKVIPFSNRINCIYTFNMSLMPYLFHVRCD